MTATSLVKTLARGRGITHPDLPWEPKQAFGAVASFYGARVEVPGGADTQTRLLGFIGRDPFWPGR
jgi:hypothetical protein